MNRQGQGPDSPAAGSKMPPPGGAPQTDEEKAAEEKAEADWWENFRRAVEDPDVSIYAFLRRNLLESLELDDKAGLSDQMVQARRKALKELFEMADAETLASRIKILENNTLLFNMQARIAMKVSRAVLETYVQARKRKDIEKLTPEQKKSAVGDTLKKELAAAEKDVDDALGSVSSVLKDKDKKEVSDTIRKAAGQMSDDRNIKAMVHDAAVLARHYLTPDNLVNIAIIVLPLVTWQYRWALALGLGAYSGRKSAYYGYQAVNAWRKGDKPEARKKGREALTALREAGGKVLLITLTPALARYPALAAGFLGVFIEALYKSSIDGIKKMLEEEEKSPGSTPIGKRATTGAKRFFINYQDKLATLTLGVLKVLAPHKVTETLETVSKRMPLTKMRRFAVGSGMIAGALARRFNKIAERKATAAIGQVRQWADAFGRAVTDPTVRAQQQEYERMAAEETALHEEEKEAELEAYREGAPSITADFEAEAAAREAEVAAEESAQEVQETAGMTEEQKAAMKKRKIESMKRHEKPAAKRTLKAKPD